MRRRGPTPIGWQRRSPSSWVSRHVPYLSAMRATLLALLIVVVVACGTDTPATTTTGSSLATTTTAVTTTTTAAGSTTVGETTTTASEIDVTVAGGEVDGPDLFEYVLGDLVEITILTDVADEIHVHGYDLRYDAEPGVPVEIVFAADAPGIFEVELEADHLPLFEIQVIPE